MLNQNKYVNFGENDFLCDPDFQDWVISLQSEHQHFWENFFLKHPHKKEAAENARRFLQNITFKEDLPDEGLIHRSLAKHLDAIKDLPRSKIIDIGKRRTFSRLQKVAAIFAGFVLMTALFLVTTSNDSKIVAQTEFGRMRSIVLPDSSVVVLNANSNIRYSENWSTKKRREVWLEGEAFFDVRHFNRDPQKVRLSEQFVVHTKDLAVEVLGTSFDIRQRRKKTEVVLQTGTIRISFRDRKYKDVFMKPGELVTYDAGQQQINKATANAADFTAWKENKLILNDPTVAEILQYLEDNFGKKIVLGKPALASKRIEGPILINNLEDALFILSTVLHAEIKEKDRTLYILPK